MRTGKGGKQDRRVLINSWLDAEGMENVSFKLLVDHAEKWMFIKNKEEKKKVKTTSRDSHDNGGGGRRRAGGSGLISVRTLAEKIALHPSV